MENIFNYAGEETLKHYLKEVDEGTLEVSESVVNQIKEALNNVLENNNSK